MNQTLERFLDAQEDMYGVALQELKAGKKVGHWMWYIFPQLKGLGRSYPSMYYGITGTEEAGAYLTHPVLGPRLVACCEAILTHRDKTAEEILGGIDAIKLRSCATLFSLVSEDGSVFHKVLQQLFEGQQDSFTLSLLNI